eukprot:gene24128-9708_t
MPGAVTTGARPLGTRSRVRSKSLVKLALAFEELDLALRKATPGVVTTGARPLGTWSMSLVKPTLTFVQLDLGLAEGYAWGSNHWRETTWNKVHVLAAVYELGFHVVHSDTDTTWFNDPWPFITSHLLNAEVHAVFSTDGLVTKNEPGDHGLEVQTDAYTNINTGVYMVKQYPDGNEFFKIWKSFQPTNIGHDQDGLNAVVRGEAMTGDKKLNPPHEAQNRVVRAAQHNKTLVSLLPISMFANAYT